MGVPRMILVTGPAGAGKTTLAHRMATGIGCPALCRDEIKEGMVRSNPGFVAEVSDELTMRTYRLFFRLLDQLLADEVTLVAEAAFQHRIWAQGLDTLTAAHQLRVIRCQVGPTVAAERMRERMSQQANRAAHADAAYLAAADAFDAIHLDVPTLDVDTSAGYRPELSELTEFAVGS